MHHQPLLAVSLRLQAVANAFVMIGLLPEQQAEAILPDHRSALEERGFPGPWGVSQGELTVRPGAHGYWAARAAAPSDLVDVPTSVATDVALPVGTTKPQLAHPGGVLPGRAGPGCPLSP
jgi:hypothetical protein